VRGTSLRGRSGRGRSGNRSGASSVNATLVSGKTRECFIYKKIGYLIANYPNRVIDVSEK
jgi:hypothetical protein